MSKELLREDEEQHGLLIKVCFSGGELRGVVIFAPDRLAGEKSEIWSWYACFYYWKWTWGLSAVFAVAVDQKQVNTAAHCTVWNIRARPGSFSALADLFFDGELLCYFRKSHIPAVF